MGVAVAGDRVVVVVADFLVEAARGLEMLVSIEGAVIFRFLPRGRVLSVSGGVGYCGEVEEEFVEGKWDLVEKEDNRDSTVVVGEVKLVDIF